MVCDRRQFVLGSLAAATATVAGGQVQRVRFGVIADVHHGLAPDALPRLQSFVLAAETRPGLDFIIHLGDGCHRMPEAGPFLEIWNRFAGPRYHVLGNHEHDHGTKADILAAYGLPKPWYSFTAGPFRFIVLDLNHLKKDGAVVDYERGNYFKESSLNWAGEEQLAWLREELAKSAAPTVIFSHQAVGDRPPGRLPPCEQEILDALQGGPTVAHLYGHLHADRVDVHEGLTCVGINSSSFHWAQGMHPYRDPLYAFVEITTDGRMTIEGRRSEYSKTDPRGNLAKGVVGADPWISDRSLELRKP